MRASGLAKTPPASPHQDDPLAIVSRFPVSCIMPAELHRLTKPSPWRLWGPYLAERAWGTVREDYSAGGDAWAYFPHDHARSRAYRWNEDGLPRHLRRRAALCFALALWNGEDAILKERPFGLTGPEGNHGEDAKDYWYYLDRRPTHAYMRALYKYPQRAFPYRRIVDENRQRGNDDPEFELLDSDAFDDDRYFDVTVEYAKAVADRHPDPHHRREPRPRGRADRCRADALVSQHLVVGQRHSASSRRSARCRPSDGSVQILAEHETLGRYHLTCEGEPELLFTENETNRRTVSSRRIRRRMSKTHFTSTSSMADAMR